MGKPKLTVVVNPKSGRARVSKAISSAINFDAVAPKLDIEICSSTSYSDAKDLCRRTVDNARTDGARPDSLVILGGDGMVNLGLNACAGTPVPLGIIPAGTGDDFARQMGISNLGVAAVSNVMAGHTERTDLARISGQLLGGLSQRFIGCVLSSGYDAAVNARVNRMKCRLGSLSYAWAILSEMAQLKPRRYRLVVDGEPLELDAVLIAIGNGGYFGGGVHVCPRASTKDNKLELTIIKPVSRRVLVSVFPKLYGDDFVSHPAIEYRQANRVELDGDNLIPMADGEAIGDVPLIVESQPAAVSVIVPKEKK